MDSQRQGIRAWRWTLPNGRSCSRTGRTKLHPNFNALLPRHHAGKIQEMIVVLSQGCAANFGDGEKIARILSQKSEVTFEFPEAKPAHSTNAENSTSAANSADFSTEKTEAFYLNVCTVKGNAGAMKLLRKAASTFPGVPIYITGCPQGLPRRSSPCRSKRAIYKPERT